MKLENAIIMGGQVFVPVQVDKNKVIEGYDYLRCDLCEARKECHLVADTWCDVWDKVISHYKRLGEMEDVKIKEREVQ